MVYLEATMLHSYYFWEFPDSNFPFAIVSTSHHGNYPLHRHKFIEIVYIMSGSGLHTLDDDVSTIAAGDCFVIPVDCVHAYTEAEDMHIVNFLFDEHLLDPFQRELHALPGYHALFTLEPTYRRQFDSCGRLRPSISERMAISELIEQMLAEWTTPAPGYRLKLLALFIQLLTDLARYYERNPGKPSAQLMQIGAVISKIEEDYAQPLSIGQLAEIACMSERNLTRRFRECVGISPIDYLNRRRIERAARELLNTTRPIAAIAGSVGMDNSNYFSRQFKRITGMNPRAYRSKDKAHALRNSIDTGVT